MNWLVLGGPARVTTLTPLIRRCRNSPGKRTEVDRKVNGKEALIDWFRCKGYREGEKDLEAMQLKAAMFEFLFEDKQDKKCHVALLPSPIPILFCNILLEVQVRACSLRLI